MTEPAFGDPLTQPFWQGAARGELMIQRCEDCGAHQFYPRPMCLACRGVAMTWVQAAGTGTVYSQSTVHVQLLPDLAPPYVIAVVELDEGPRLTTNIVGGPSAIGERVRVSWREREGAPPVPVFTPVGG